MLWKVSQTVQPVFLESGHRSIKNDKRRNW